MSSHLRRSALLFAVSVNLVACGGDVVPGVPDAPDAAPDVVATPDVALDESAPPDDAASDALTPPLDVSLDSAARDVTATSDVVSDSTPVSDAETVTVRITAPSNGASVSGVVPFTAAATATAGIARVTFFSEGGAYRIAEDTTAPYAIDWYTAGYVPDGAQRLRVVATDTAGRQATQDITVTVRNTASSTLPPAEVARLTAWFEARRGSRYMEGSCQPTTYAGWSGVPLQLCRYRVSDAFSGGTRQADVILADAEPAQLARWTVQAALERRGSVRRSDTDAIAARIIEQSGAQFAVAGVVYEDMDGTGQRIYPFRNGVTVRVEGLPYATREQPSTAQMAAYRTGSIAFVGRYGRIVGTTPDEWTALTRESVAADRSNWPDIVARAYRAAWGQDRNALIVAWARSNL